MFYGTNKTNRTKHKFHKSFLDISHIQSKCGKRIRILCGILSVPHNIVKDPNKVMQC